MRLNNLNFQYNSEFIFRSFCYEFNIGITTIVAKNGVGKSTLIQCIVDEYILSLKGKSSGMVAFGNKKFTNKNNNPEDFIFTPSEWVYKKTILKHISQKSDHSLLPWYNSIDNLKVIASFEKRTVDFQRYITNLESFKINPTQKIESLSGGQKQIVNILKTLAFEANLILMDEPFSALDLENSIRLKKLILEWQKEHQATIILISHSIDDILELSDTILILDKRPVKIHKVLENNFGLRDKNKIEIMKFLDGETR